MAASPGSAPDRVMASWFDDSSAMLCTAVTRHWHAHDAHVGTHLQLHRCRGVLAEVAESSDEEEDAVGALKLRERLLAAAAAHAASSLSRGFCKRRSIWSDVEAGTALRGGA